MNPKPQLIVGLSREQLHRLLTDHDFGIVFDDDIFGPEVPVHVVVCSEEGAEDYMDRLEVTHYSNGEPRRKRRRS